MNQFSRNNILRKISTFHMFSWNDTSLIDSTEDRKHIINQAIQGDSEALDQLDPSWPEYDQIMRDHIRQGNFYALELYTKARPEQRNRALELFQSEMEKPTLTEEKITELLQETKSLEESAQPLRTIMSRIFDMYVLNMLYFFVKDSEDRSYVRVLLSEVTRSLKDRYLRMLGQGVLSHIESFIDDADYLLHEEQLNKEKREELESILTIDVENYRVQNLNLERIHELLDFGFYPEWAKVGYFLYLLNKTEDPQQIVKIVDRINGFAHHTGSVLDYVIEYGINPYAILEAKAHPKSLELMNPYLSPEVRKMLKRFQMTGSVVGGIRGFCKYGYGAGNPGSFDPGGSSGIFYDPSQYTGQGSGEYSTAPGISRNLSGPEDRMPGFPYQEFMYWKEQPIYTIEELAKIIENRLVVRDVEGADYYLLILKDLKRRVNLAKNRYGLMKKGIYIQDIEDEDLRDWIRRMKSMSPEQRREYIDRQRRRKRIEQLLKQKQSVEPESDE